MWSSRHDVPARRRDRHHLVVFIFDTGSRVTAVSPILRCLPGTDAVKPSSTGVVTLCEQSLSASSPAGAAIRPRLAGPTRDRGVVGSRASAPPEDVLAPARAKARPVCREVYIWLRLAVSLAGVVTVRDSGTTDAEAPNVCRRRIGADHTGVNGHSWGCLSRCGGAASSLPGTRW